MELIGKAAINGEVSKWIIDVFALVGHDVVSGCWGILIHAGGWLQYNRALRILAMDDAEFDIRVSKNKWNEIESGLMLIHIYDFPSPAYVTAAAGELFLWMVTLKTGE